MKRAKDLGVPKVSVDQGFLVLYVKMVRAPVEDCMYSVLEYTN